MYCFSILKNVICKFVFQQLKDLMENSIWALNLKKQLDDLRPIDKIQEERIMQKFRLDWNYHSNHLEGNQLTYGETKALILFGITAQGKPLQDHFEITGHNEAINWVIDVVKGDYPLNENFIRELHTLLLKQSYEVDAITHDGKRTKKRISVGSYKTSPNHVKTKTGEIFYFASPEETPSKMTDLINWFREKCAQKEFNAIFLAAEFHYKFIRIHPFDDGNGRTARILMNFILMKFNFPPVIIKTEDKDNYFAVLQQADAGNLEAFVDYIAKNLVYSLEIMIAGAKGESIEEDDDLDKEIALLEQKLLFFEKKNIPKEQTLDKNFIEYFVFLLVEKFFTSNFKFGKLYEEFNFYIQLGDKINYLNSENYHDFLNDNFDKIFNDKEFVFEYSFKNLKSLKLDESYFYSKLEIKFFLNSLQIKLNGREFIESQYQKYIIEKDVDTIIKSETKRHTIFIEQKIAETERRDR